VQTLTLAWRELWHRRAEFVFGLLCIAVAAGVFVAGAVALRADEQVAARILARKEAETRDLLKKMNDEIRRATLRLGFNVLLLPKDQSIGEWFARDEGEATMPESYAERLARSGTILIRHILPILQKRIVWPETHKTILLIGTRGEIPNIFKPHRKPLLDVIPPGKMVVGYDVWKELGLKEGAEVMLMGRKFTVIKCQEQRGNKDDVSVWINLKEAQELLGNPGRVNAILALQCVCSNVWDFVRLREDLARRLPEARVVELDTNKVLARAEARYAAMKRAKQALELEKKNRQRLNLRRRRTAAWTTAALLLAAGVLFFFLSWSNVRRRRVEIAVLRALGYRASRILGLVLTRALLIGLGGAIVGVLAGAAAGEMLARRLAASQEVAAPAFSAVFAWWMPAAAVVLGLLVSVVAAWIPAVTAAVQDPADILRQE